MGPLLPEPLLPEPQAQGAELVLLAFAVALAQFAALAVEHGAGELVPALATVQLDQDAASVRLVVNVGPVTS